ncbi:porin family protein [Flaviaesturariibacter aridisoli]|uniref:PorT family protein n=1 Tax=Flaviaesturariibacter aridisoli TaxID=2545761 RepID=A0A4R4E2K2_9BACT|nr:porin family protein [Flaviaesturariibacter aridisoli]TCZ73629.1 PorT family protein [Flaviaesturariibacter aridisoli]
MRKTSFLLLGCLLLFAGTFAQTGRLKVGLETGFGVASLRGSSAYNDLVTARPSTYQGIYASWALNDRWFLRTGAGFSLNGAKQRNSVTFTDPNGVPNGTYQAYTNLPYLNVPLLAGVSFGPSKRLYAVAGPYVGFLLSAHDTYDGHEATDTKRLYEHTDFGVMGGLGVELPLHKRFGFTIEIRDQLGLTNISKPASGAGYPPLKNNAAHLIIGVNYKF